MKEKRKKDIFKLEYKNILLVKKLEKYIKGD